MRKKNQEITDLGIIEEILGNSAICRLGLLDGARPYIVPVNYGYKDKFIFIHSAHEGKKIDLIRQNNKVCFEIEQVAEIAKDEIPCKWATVYRSAIGYGEIEIITDYVKKVEGLKIIMEHNGFEGEITFEKKSVDAMVLLKLRITEIAGKQSGNWNKIYN
jgi:uncharacterized protein